MQKMIFLTKKSVLRGFWGVRYLTLHLRRISAESGRGVLLFFKSQQPIRRGVFNIFKSQPNLDGGFLIAHVLKSADFGQNRCFQAQKDPKIFFALRAGDQISDFL